jgi:exodeoxyribonuclease-5
MPDGDVSDLLHPTPKTRLSDEQQAAFDLMRRFTETPWARTLCVHGLAGTGKTTTLSEYARDLGSSMHWLCCLTGKAASILRRKTGLAATTIHSALYELEQIKRDDRGRKEMKWHSTHERGSLQNRVVLVDECGQVGENIMNDLLATGCAVIAAGDPGQLGPVKQPQYFRHADFELTEIHRQALDSPIIRQAHRVRQGLRYVADTEKFRVVSRAFDGDILDADILLTWTNKRRMDLNAQARRLRGIDSLTPVAGEPVMCRQNYKPAGIFRGAIYKLAKPFRDGDTAITIDVDGEIITVQRVKFDGVRKPSQ